jgi:hypothetical protein
MVLAGLCLGAAVVVSWPEPETRIVRLPYGESQPKAPREVAQATAAKPAETKQVSVAPPAAAQPAPVAVEEPEEVRVLAVIEPESSEDEGPPPVPSEGERADDGYEQESPEELGAEPLPGAELTPPLPPAAG